MSLLKVLSIVFCVFIICIGQLLFKKASFEIEAYGGWLHLKVLLIVGIAGIFYGGATLLWIELLRNTDLSKAYPYMGLSFLIVPALSYVLFQEKIDFMYLVGALLIFVGIVIIGFNS
jgi:drug/metabolite transporter (DMT)-like permease